MRGDEADLGVGVLHPNSHSSLVPSHARQPSLLSRSLYILDKMQHRGLYIYTKRGPDKLAAPKTHVSVFAPQGLHMIVQVLLHSRLPSLLSHRISIHNLLRAEIDYLLEADDGHLWLLSEVGSWKYPRSQIFGEAFTPAVDIVCANPDIHHLSGRILWKSSCQLRIHIFVDRIV